MEPKAIEEVQASTPEDKGGEDAALAKKLDDLARLRDLKAAPYRLLASALEEEMPDMGNIIALVIERHELEMVEMNEAISRLEAEIKVKVLASGFDVKGSEYRATITPGRVSWATRALEKYAAGHPEVKKFKRTGNPYVTIAPVKALGGF